MDINWTSLLTGIAGGIIPATVAYYMGMKNINISQKIHKDNLEVEREKIFSSVKSKSDEIYQLRKIELEKINFNDKKKNIVEYLSILQTDMFYEIELDFKKLSQLRILLYMSCTSEYFSYLHRLYEYILQHPQMLDFKKLWKETDGSNELWDTIIEYDKIYGKTMKATRKLFHGEPIEPIVIQS
ncbi:MAG: hypothetical protein RBR49_10960 [Desulfovibrio desulfuricans]|nr:hypothetical protein [Desulfovibrio desulfuricans]